MPSFPAQSQGPRIHDAVGVEFFFQGPEHIHLFFAEVGFHERGQHPAHAVVVAEGAVVLHDLLDNACLEGLEFIKGHHFCDKDKIQVGALGIKMGGMAHEDDAGCLLDMGSDALVQVFHMVPGHARFQGVDEDSEIIQGIPVNGKDLWAGKELAKNSV